MGRYQVTTEDGAHAEEFMRNPLGRHSPGLRRVEIALRSEPRAGHLVLVCTRPWREWRIGRLPEKPGDPVQLESVCYTSKESAEREVFARRWLTTVGEPLPQ
jgi:hypothetical protein